MIVTARRLATASPGKPRQADLRRAISSAYYALFHAIAKDAADMLVGVGRNRPDKAWAQAYRALHHGEARSACEAVRNMGFPTTIKSCADAFVQLQQKRHFADYDPHYRARREHAVSAIEQAEREIAALKASSKKDRRAFAVQILLKRRRS